MVPDVKTEIVDPEVSKYASKQSRMKDLLLRSRPPFTRNSTRKVSHLRAPSVEIKSSQTHDPSILRSRQFLPISQVPFQKTSSLHQKSTSQSHVEEVRRAVRKEAEKVSKLREMEREAAETRATATEEQAEIARKETLEAAQLRGFRIHSERPALRLRRLRLRKKAEKASKLREMEREAAET
eukprot:CAMPEP_0194269744 /NCGR_PEP_ID=MMETSP0169-20130528/3858_1 /TAXON_ID=218684 /ORGANISM="Corethron pennatum, Strain L29A3" /LENGTH=181 /DNA_ID=CAMNT_0039011503 /DNA_START=20 /DNA_END=561 /DNA_ORIENTATION=-